MIKFLGRGEKGEPIYGFGLSEANIDRLKAGQPIYFPGEQIGIYGNVLIFYGKDEEHMKSALSQVMKVC